METTFPARVLWRVQIQGVSHVTTESEDELHRLWKQAQDSGRRYRVTEYARIDYRGQTLLAEEVLETSETRKDG